MSTEWHRPERCILNGKYCILEPLAEGHGDGLFDCLLLDESRFRYLPDRPYRNREEFDSWMAKSIISEDPMFFTVIDKNSEIIGGRQSLMRITPEVSIEVQYDKKNLTCSVSQHGVIEIGHIFWSPLIAKTRVTTECIFLMLRYVFDEIRYRRVEWKCDNENVASKRAAERFGFTAEGIFRQHLIVKGLNRDTAWFSIIDKDWPRIKKSYESWLDESNFDEFGKQKQKLSSFLEV